MILTRDPHEGRLTCAAVWKVNAKLLRASSRLQGVPGDIHPQAKRSPSMDLPGLLTRRWVGFLPKAWDACCCVDRQHSRAFWPSLCSSVSLHVLFECHDLCVCLCRGHPGPG